jgi:bile acid:Na+ symporter, BASS family
VTAIRKFCLAVAVAAFLDALVGWQLGEDSLWRPATAVAAIATAVGLGAIRPLKGYQFTAWIVAAVTVAMVFPELLTPLNPDNRDVPQNKWIMLAIIQTVMFGMGTQMSLSDFAALGRMSYGVVIGIILQFSIMPLVGFAIGHMLGFEPEIAAGMVLIGSCSSGLASNVMAYMARANLVLSVAVTAAGTLLAPVLTPLWMKLLASTAVDVDFVDMMLQIVKIVIVPIGAALLHDYLRRASSSGRRLVISVALVSATWLVVVAAGGWDWLAEHVAGSELAAIGIGNFLAGAVVVGVVYHFLTLLMPRIVILMPLFSMAGIVAFTAITTAAGRDSLLRIGWLLLLAVILHNLIGYSLGYWISRGCGLDKNSARTVALEVGIHNGGMATGLASHLGSIGKLGLAAAIFSPWMNVSGSILANYWRRRAERESP